MRLAKAVKHNGGKVWMGLTRKSSSLRDYNTFAEIRDLIARTAFTQLRYSALLLAGTLAGMLLTYIAPVVLLFAHDTTARILGLTAWFLMSASFFPTLRYYRLSPLWAPLLPLAALFYTYSTWLSAFRFWMGTRRFMERPCPSPETNLAPADNITGKPRTALSEVFRERLPIVSVPSFEQMVRVAFREIPCGQIPLWSRNLVPQKRTSLATTLPSASTPPARLVQFVRSHELQISPHNKSIKKFERSARLRNNLRRDIASRHPGLHSGTELNHFFKLLCVRERFIHAFAAGFEDWLLMNRILAMRNLWPSLRKVFHRNQANASQRERAAGDQLPSAQLFAGTSASTFVCSSLFSRCCKDACLRSVTAWDHAAKICSR